MLKVYFGAWGDGRLKRLPYLGYHILLMVLMFIAVFGTIMALGATESTMGGDIAATQAAIMDKAGFLIVFAVVALIFVVIIAQVNIMAKRIRDMGLPALWTILGIIAVSLLLNILFPAQQTEITAAVVKTAEGTAAAASANSTVPSMIVQGFDLLVFLCLILIPSDTFAKK